MENIFGARFSIRHIRQIQENLLYTDLYEFIIFEGLPDKGEIELSKPLRRHSHK